MKEGWVFQLSHGEYKYMRADQVKRVIDRHTDEDGDVDEDRLFSTLDIAEHPMSSFGADGTMSVRIHRCNQDAYGYAAIIQYETDDDMLMIQDQAALLVWLQRMTDTLEMAIKTADHRALMGR